MSMYMMLTLKDGTVKDCDVTAFAFGDLEFRGETRRLKDFMFWFDDACNGVSVDTIAHIDFYPKPPTQSEYPE